MSWPHTSDTREWKLLLDERIGIMADSGEPDAERVAREWMRERWRRQKAREKPDAWAEIAERARERREEG